MTYTDEHAKERRQHWMNVALIGRETADEIVALERDNDALRNRLQVYVSSEGNLNTILGTKDIIDAVDEVERMKEADLYCACDVGDPRNDHPLSECQYHEGVRKERDALTAKMVLVKEFSRRVTMNGFNKEALRVIIEGDHLSDGYLLTKEEMSVLAKARDDFDEAEGAQWDIVTEAIDNLLYKHGVSRVG